MSENHRLEEAVKAGVKIPKDGYWGNVPSKICGAYGGEFEDKMVTEEVESIENKITNNE